MSMHLDRMKEGDSIRVEGPIGRFNYFGKGMVNIKVPGEKDWNKKYR